MSPFDPILDKLVLPSDVKEMLAASPRVVMPKDRTELLDLSFGGPDVVSCEIAYDVPGKGRVVEATLSKCSNGAALNYTEPYMRRRDPNCTVVGDNEPTDKERFDERFGMSFADTRRETLEWLKANELIITFFRAGGNTYGYPSILIAPLNAAFFALTLADLQGFVSPDEVDDNYVPNLAIFLAPSFRHTHFNGQQVVVHNRQPEIHEIFSYNLYPGPSAKKGVYGYLLTVGEKEGWATAHASTVQLVTPYDNIFTVMHEGASGSGKSEMLEEIHRQPDGRVLFAENILNKQKLIFDIGDTCTLNPVTDDMALCHPRFQNDNRKLWVSDAENGWFLRIDHITKYGVAPTYEALTIHPKEPLVFINLKGVPNATCLIWEHTEDEPGVRCPNPRVVVPRHQIPGVVDGPVPVDVRSFGVRTPPCTKENPTYGILGVLHILPPSLGWLWRLVAPRGHANPSINGAGGLTSEGVGSYWPFATGKCVRQANLLLEQILAAPATRHILIPNQYIGAWKIGFMAEWLSREYLARRGSAKLRPELITPSRCHLLGYALDSLRVDGNLIPKDLLQVDTQPAVGVEGYDAGAALLQNFFKEELEKFLVPELHPLGRKIIECCLSEGTVNDYQELIPMQ